jgi:phosphate transport system protein
MAQFWEQQLHTIREQVVMMSSLTERNLGLAMRALTERDDKLADLTEAEDSQIDNLEMRIDEMVVTFISTHGAAAGDTRFVLAASKISSNLERIADEATTIARRARKLNSEPPLKPLVDLPVIATTAQEMLRDSITAFIQKESDLAVEIIGRDRTVDDIYRTIVRELTAYMTSDPKAIARALDLMTVAKAIERVADHATNIAEEVYYLYRAQDIRHDLSLKEKA